MPCLTGSLQAASWTLPPAPAFDGDLCLRLSLGVAPVTEAVGCTEGLIDCVSKTASLKTICFLRIIELHSTVRLLPSVHRVVRV
jgi:hypothetical protein